jgi:hypothetical protein
MRGPRRNILVGCIGVVTMLAMGRQATAQAVVAENQQPWPENVVKIAAENWDKLEELRRKHVAALKELERGLDSEEKQTGRVAERASIAGRILTTELELTRDPAQRRKLCEEAIARVDRLKSATDRLDRLFVDATRAGFEVELQLAKCPARSPEEVTALVAEAEAALGDFQLAHEQIRVGAQGATAAKESLAGYNLCIRVAELLRAVGHYDEALKRQKQACEYADQCVEAARATYSNGVAGGVTFEQVMSVQRDRATAWQLLARIDPAAARELRKTLREAAEKK